ncbi:hypothetical protein WISP_66399 [Willisornis vidua]|uniref:Uncharacterized protein n=1 Tax=Willisornis vidua TaxID=1566151 RepID=A0ABQ9DEQ7_9PASS|nr:hypothetical protein WISP_66399 [Willisornis vidua]
MRKSVESLAAVKHKEHLLNSPFFLSGNIKGFSLYLSANSCKTGKEGAGCTHDVCKVKLDRTDFIYRNSITVSKEGQ